MHDPKKAARLAALKELVAMLEDEEAREMAPEPIEAPEASEEPQEGGDEGEEDDEELKAKLAAMGD